MMARDCRRHTTAPTFQMQSESEKSLKLGHVRRLSQKQQRRKELDEERIFRVCGVD
jgi:hypothetical protein